VPENDILPLDASASTPPLSPITLFEVFGPRSNPRFHGETIDGAAKDQRGKLDGDPSTKHYPLTPDLFDQHAAGRIRLGVAFLLDDGTSRCGTIDIDIYKDFALLEFLAKVRELNDHFIPVRTRSGGLHLYVFFDPAVDAQELLTYLKAVIKDLGLPPKTETRPASSDPATPQEIAKRASGDFDPKNPPSDCPGGWLHLPYCGADPAKAGSALNWDGSDMSEEEFIAAIEAREHKDKAALQAARILKTKPTKDYEYAIEDGNGWNGIKSSVGAYVQKNPQILLPDLITWANTELRATVEDPSDEKWWKSLRIPTLCRKVLAWQATQQPMTKDQKATYKRLKKFAIEQVRADKFLDEEIIQRVLEKNAEDLDRIDPRAAEAAVYAAMREIEDKGDNAGKLGRPVKPHPIYLAEQQIRVQYDLARDAAFRPYYYDETRHCWVLDYLPFKEILKAEYEKDKAVPRQQDNLTLEWNLALGNSRAFWSDPPVDRINLQNGILDINTLVLEPHSEESKDFLFPNQFQVAWDPAATCPTMDKVATDVLGPAEGIVVYEILGCLMFPDLDRQKAFLFQGAGGNGKSIILDVYDLILGKSNCSSVSLQDIESNRFSLVNLVGKLANIDADMSSRRIPSSQKFKKITSGLDRLDIEQKFREIQTGIRLYTRLLFSCNQFPRCDDNPEGFWSRWIVLKFDKKSFRDGQKDATERKDPRILIPMLMAEAPGIVRKSIEAYKKVRERGAFTQTDDMKAWFQEFKFNTDSLSVWLNENTVRGEKCTASNRICARPITPIATPRTSPPWVLTYSRPRFWKYALA
jgi:P4 family phage/plasmid primase-like protien